VPRNEDGKKFIELISNDKPDAFVPLQPDIVIEDSFDLRPYGVEGKLVHTPGHSDCSISVLLDSGEAIIGDMIINSPFDGKPCLALIANDVPKLIESLKELLKSASVFYGGHSGPYSKEEVASLLNQ
jgi:glyoxylase-like metal-dependent hydrolase (beta-lactamase superfamily II)